VKFVLALTFATILTAGCAPATRITLLPQPDGKPSAVIVTPRHGSSTVVSHPFESAEVRAGTAAIKPLNAQTVRQRYSRLLSVQPPPPERFTLYFISGTSDLTRESEVLLTEAVRRVAHRSGGEIFITGHTDRVGSLTFNDTLSLRRANAVRNMIIKRGGIDPVRVHANGRGKRDPVSLTTDESGESKNRRVEIVVR
jgi:outer membrane protein OmpA-like peptidoglycan-associated protein